MTGLLDAVPKPKVARVTRAVLTWPHVVLGLGILAFIGFALWLTATNFDASEIKTWVGIGGVWMAREVWPIVRGALRAVAEGQAAGNE